MVKKKSPCSALVVSSGHKSGEVFTALMQQSGFAPVAAAGSVGEAKRLLSGRDFDIIIVNAPLPDDFGLDLAVDAAGGAGCGVLLCVNSDLLEMVGHKAEDAGVLTLGKPTSRQLIYQSVRLLEASVRRARALEERIAVLQGRLEEQQLVFRAKLLLMERRGLSEAEAHRFIEKTAMDGCLRRREVAESIIIEYTKRGAAND